MSANKHFEYFLSMKRVFVYFSNKCQMPPAVLIVKVKVSLQLATGEFSRQLLARYLFFPKDQHVNFKKHSDSILDKTKRPKRHYYIVFFAKYPCVQNLPAKLCRRSLCSSSMTVIRPPI
jgi:hypothetical protein